MKKIIVGLLFFYFVIFPFGQLLRLPLGFFGFPPEIHLYLTDLVLFCFLIFWAWWRFLILRTPYQFPKLAKPIFLFWLIAAFSLAFNSFRLSLTEVFVSSLYLFRWLIYAGLYFAVADLKNHLVFLNKENLFRFLIAIGSAVAAFGLIQYLLWPNLKVLEYLEWDPHYYRVVGSFLDPGFTGMILVLTLILIVVFGWEKKNKLWLAVGGFMVYIALALTYSRASYLAFLLGIMAVSFFKKSPKFLALTLSIFVITWLFLPRPAGEGGKLERTYSIESRFQNWRQALVMVKNNPISGVGFNAYRYAQRKYEFLTEEGWQLNHAASGSDSSLLFVLATTGIFGFLAYIWLWEKVLMSTCQSFRINLLSLGVFASTIALLAHSFFLNSLFYPWIMAWMWILLAMEKN